MSSFTLTLVGKERNYSENVCDRRLLFVYIFYIKLITYLFIENIEHNMLLIPWTLSPSLLSLLDAIPSADQVRITPSLRSQRGTVWTKNKVNFEHWEAEVTFRVSGRGRMGADGLVRRAETSVGWWGSQWMFYFTQLIKASHHSPVVLSSYVFTSDSSCC